MIPSPDIGFVYPKTGLDVDLRFEDRPQFTSSGSMYLDGTDDFLNLDGLTWTSAGANYSFTCWVKSKTGSTDAKRVFGAKSSSASDRINLYWDSGVTLKSYSEDGTTNTFTIGAVGLDNTWHHFALTVGSGTAVKFYLDGQLIATDTQPDMDFSSCDDFVVGAAYDGNTATSLDGNICHFGVWHDELSQAEIRELMTATTYAEAITKGGSTPRAYFLLESNATDSVGAITYTTSSSTSGTLTNGAAIVGDRAHLPNGYDLTGNQLNAIPFSGRAWVGDGTGDYCEAPASTDTVMTGGTFSTSFWCKTSDASEQTAMAMIGTYGWQIALLGGSDPALWKFQVLDDSGWETVYASEADSNMPSKFDDGKWRFIVATATAGTMRLYVNGAVDADTDTINTGVSYPNAATVLHIGSDKNDATNWQGSLADLKIWNIALSQAQIDELFANREQILPTGASSTNLKAWYPLNDYAVSGADSLNGLYMADASQYNNPAKSINGIMEFSQSGIPQLGLRSSSSRILYDEVDDVVTIGDNAAIDGLFATGGSLAVWIMPFSDGEGTYGRIVETGAGGYFLLCSSESGSACKLYFSHHWDGDDGTWITNATDLAYGEWNHVVVTYNASSTSNDPIIYVNASVKAITESGSGPSGTVNADANDKLFGNSSGGDRTFDGIISSVAMWKGTILDAAAVTVMYNSGIQGFDLLTDSGDYDYASAVDGLWVLDNPVTIQDLSTNSNNGTVSGTPNMATVPEGDTAGLSVFGTLTQNRLGGVAMPMSIVADEDAGSSPGILAYAKGPHTSFDNTDFTVTMWVYLANTPSNMRYFHWVPGTGYILLKLSSAGKHQCLIEGGTTNATLEVNKDVRNAWSFVAFRKDAENDLDAFAGLVTDASLTTDTDSTIVGDFVGSAEWYLGSDNAAYRGLSGSIAMPRIWTDTALSDAQINALFNSGKRFLLGDS